MRLRHVVVVLALGLTAPGCWVQTGFDGGRSAHNGLESGIIATTVDQLEVAWTAAVGASAREALIEQGRVYIRSEGHVTALSATSGDQLWQADSYVPIAGVTRPLLGTTAPAIVGGQVFVPTETSPAAMGPCGIVVLDPDTGQQLTWHQTSTIPDLPPLGDPGLMCRTADALAAGTRVFVPWWSFGQYIERFVCPAPNYVGIISHGFGAVDTAGPPDSWKTESTESGCGVTGSSDAHQRVATLVGDQVVVPADRFLVAHTQTSCGGAVCPAPWIVDVGGPTVGPAVALANGDIAVARADGQLVVVDGTSHTVEWTGSIGGASALTTPVSATPTSIFVAYPDGTLAAFPTTGCGAATCAADWTADLPSPASVRPSSAADVVYIGSTDGTVTALPAAGCGATTCTALWSHDVGGQVSGAPALWGGRLIVGSADGTVTAFALPT